MKILGSLVIVLALGWWAGTHWYEPGWRYDVLGVDVSHHQGSIDWPTLAQDRVVFAYIKATEGGDFQDPRFAENWRGAREAGVHPGAYHFFTLCRPGADQAANFIASVPNEPGMLPPAVDLEFGGNCSARPSLVEFRTELDVFLEQIAAHFGAKPMAYTTDDFYDFYLAANPPDVHWWIRSLVAEPNRSDWVLWQYYPGSRDGVTGSVDRNAFRGTSVEFEALLNGF